MSMTNSKMMKRLSLMFCTILALNVLSAQSTSGMERVFYDDFKNNKNGWFTSMSGSNKSKVSNDQKFLVIDVNDNGSIERSWANTSIDFNRDFVLKARIKSENADDKGDNYFGFLIGLSNIKYMNEQGWYGFRLYNNERKARLYASKDDGVEFFKRVIQRPTAYDPREYNEITIERKNGMMAFYLNETEIYTNDATTTASGTIVFEARNKQVAYLKEIEVYQ